MTPHRLTLCLVLFIAAATAPKTSQASTPQAEQQPSAQPATDSEAKPDAEGVYQVGHGVTPPKLIHTVDPIFPKGVRKRKLEGRTTITLTVDISGNPQNARISRSAAEGIDKKLQPAALLMDDQALIAVKQYKFDPATYQGKPVPVELNIEVNFKIT